MYIYIYDAYVYMMHIYDAYNTYAKLQHKLTILDNPMPWTIPKNILFLWCLDHQPRNARFTAGFPTCAVPLKFPGDCTSCCFTLSTQSCVQQKNKTEASSEVDGHYEWCIRKWLDEVDITPYANHGAGIFSYKLTGS